MGSLGKGGFFVVGKTGAFALGGCGGSWPRARPPCLRSYDGNQSMMRSGLPGSKKKQSGGWGTAGKPWPGLQGVVMVQRSRGLLQK